MDALLCAMMTYYKVGSHTCDRTSKWGETLNITEAIMLSAISIYFYFGFSKDVFTIPSWVTVVVIVYVFLTTFKTALVREMMFLNQWLNLFYRVVHVCTTGFQMPNAALRPLTA